MSDFASERALVHLLLISHGTLRELIEKSVTTYAKSDSIQRGTLVDFFAISIAMINPRISASKANLMPRYLAKQPFKKPLQLLKIPPQPECLGAPSMLTLIQFLEGGCHIIGMIVGLFLALPLILKL